MKEKVFITHKNPDSKYEGLITYGDEISCCLKMHLFL